MTLPVTTEEFWRKRIHDTVARGREIHTIIYDIDPDTWNRIQSMSLKILSRCIGPHSRILDAGCGYGALYDALIQDVRFKTIDYTGADISPDLVSIAKLRHPELKFECIDLTSTNWTDNQFDYTIFRSVGDMLIENEYKSVWDSVLKEAERISHRILMFDYNNLNDYTVIIEGEKYVFKVA